MKKKKYIVNGQVYEIPDEESGAFLKDFPEAKVQYDVQGKIYEIPHTEADAFEADMGLKKKPSSNVGSTPSGNGVSGSQATDPKLQEYLNARAEQRKTAVNDAYTSVEMPKAKSFSTAYEKPVKEAKITEQFSVNKESEESQKANNEAVRKQALATTAKRSGRKEEDVQKDVDEGKLVLSSDGKGNKIYARQPGAGETLIRGLANATNALSDAATIVYVKTTGTPEELAAFYELIELRKKQEAEKEFELSDITNIASALPSAEEVKGLPTAEPTTLGALTEMAGGLAPDIALAAGTGGMSTAAKTAIIGSKMYASSYGNKAYELYEMGKEQYMKQGMDEKQASILAAQDATETAAEAALPDAALNTLFFSGKLHSPAANNFMSVMKGAMKDAVKVGGLGAAASGATSAIESGQGYDVDSIISRMAEAGGDFAKMDLLFKVLPILRTLPKAAQSAVKEFAVDPVVKPLVEAQLKTLRQDIADNISKDLAEYEQATKNIRGIVPEEKMASLGGRINKRQNRLNGIEIIKNDIKELEAKKKELPESLQTKIDETIKEREGQIKDLEKEIEGVDKEIEQISKSKGTGLEKEKDEATGEPIVSKEDTKLSEPIEGLNERGAPVEEITPETPTQERNVPVSEPNKEAANFVFNQNEELKNIGGHEEYAQYISDFFPESKIKTPVYRGDNYLDKNKGYLSDKSKVKPGEEQGKYGIYFTPNRKYAELYAKKGNTKAVLLDIKNPRKLFAPSKWSKRISENEGMDFQFLKKEDIDNLKKQGYDGITVDVEEWVYEGELRPYKENFEVIAFDNSQVHILGSTKDIENFKNWKEQNKSKSPTQERNVPVSENPALKDVESTAKALSDLDKSNPTILQDIKRRFFDKKGLKSFIVERTKAKQKLLKGVKFIIDGNDVTKDISDIDYKILNPDTADKGINNKILKKRLEEKVKKINNDLDFFENQFEDKYGTSEYNKVVNEYKSERAKIRYYLSEIDNIKIELPSESEVESGDVSYSEAKFNGDRIEVETENANDKDDSIDYLSEAYHKAKVDGSNPELVKAVEDLLSPKKEQNKPIEGNVPVSENLPAVESFETAKGSKYTIGEDGRTSRYKTATKEQNEPQDLTVFAKFKDVQQEQNFLEAVQRSEESGKKVYVIDKEGNIYNTNEEVKGKDVRLAIIDTKQNKVIDFVETSLTPKEGFNVFDQRRYEEGGKEMREKHLGNKVTKINYKEQNKPIQSEATSESPIESVEFIPTEEAKPTEAEPIKIGEGAGGEPPKEEGKVTEEGGDAGKEFDEMMKELPNDTGDVKKYLSGKTINKFTSRETENDQTYREDKLIESAQHGQDLINKAKEVYGDEYVEKTLEYLEEKNVPTDVKAVALVSLENEMEARVSADPKNIGLHKLQDLVREKSQAFLHKASIAINAGRFRKLKEIGFDLTKYTDEFFTSKEKENKQKVEKLIEANADTIQKEYEASFEERVQEAAEKLRKEERVAERKEKREKVHKKIDDFTNKWIKKLTPKNDIGEGIKVKKQGAGAEEVFKSIGATMKAAYDAGEAISKVVKDAVDYISEKLGNREWGIVEFVSDAEKMLTGSMKEDKPNVYVKQALIDAGFGKKAKIKGEEVSILDWKKLAGEEGSISKISAAVAKALEKDGYSEAKLKEISQDFIDEYIKIRQRVIENGLNEIARLNKKAITPEQKSAAKRLSELYNYGLFDNKNMAEFEVVLNKALGISELTGKRIKRVEEIAKAMSVALSSEYQGKKVEQYQIRAAEQHIQELIRDEIVDELSVESIRKEGKIDKSKVAYKVADVIGSYMDLTQMMLLNSVKNAVLENPISGYMENVFNKSANRGVATKDVRKRMTNLGGAVLKEMITEKGAPYGDVTSTFVTRSSIERDLNKITDKKAYQAVLSTLTGKTLLSGVDSYYKANNVQRNFLYNMQKVLTQDRKINGEIVKGMTKDEARNYIAQRMSKQSYEEAKKTARDIIEKVNKDAGRKILNDSELFVERMANDIVKGSLVTGGQITPDMVTGSYDAAYEAAGRGLGHVANNYLSRMIGSETGRIESKIKQSVKEKDFANAAFYRMYGILFKNILNPYVGGGTNWAFLTLERGGAGLVTGLGSMIKDRKARKMDLTTDAGIKDMKRALYANQKIRDKFIRGAVGGSVGLLTALVWGQIRNKEEYEKWRKNNEWATKYTDILYPQVGQYFDAEERGELPRQVEKNLNLSTQFDKGEIAWQAFKYAVKGENEKAAGKVGQLNPFGAPIPWRLVRDVDQIVTGISGGEPYRVKSDVPETFWQGYWKGGLVDYMGFAPHSGNYGDNKKSNSGMPQKPQKPKKKEKKQFAN